MEQKQLAFDNQWALYKIKQLELDVKSPINGLVVTWDLRNRLIHRPVQRGQVLLRVADPDGPWQLELHMPENRVGHIVAFQHGLYEQSREKLREMLREETRASWAKRRRPRTLIRRWKPRWRPCPMKTCTRELVAQLRQRLAGQLQAIVANVTDQELRAKLDGVLREKSYDEARTKLQAILPEVSRCGVGGPAARSRRRSAGGVERCAEGGVHSGHGARHARVSAP